MNPGRRRPLPWGRGGGKAGGRGGAAARGRGAEGGAAVLQPHPTKVASLCLAYLSSGSHVVLSSSSPLRSLVVTSSLLL